MASKESIRLWKVQLANAVVIRTMSLGEGCEVAKMEASQLLQTYQMRKAGFEDGLFKYPPALYEAVCTLVDALGRLPSDEEIRLHFDVGDAVFVVARTGVALARLPIGEAENISAEMPDNNRM